MSLTITDEAREKLIFYQKVKDQFLRISVVSGGCSGMTYNAVIDTKINDQDETIFSDDSIKIVADKRSTLFLDGLHVDFSSDLIQAGFRLTNPNASESCACGSSFGV